MGYGENMQRFELIHSIRESINPRPWLAWPVIPLEDGGGVLGFAAIREWEAATAIRDKLAQDLESQSDMLSWAMQLGQGIDKASAAGGRVVREIPIEMFNHELKTLDLTKPNQAAAFFADYGLLGNNDYSKALLNPDYSPRDFSDYYMGVFSAMALSEGLDESVSITETITNAIMEYRSRVQSAVSGIEQDGYQVIDFATLYEAQFEIDALSRYAQIVKALASCANEAELADYLGCESQGTETSIQSCLQQINGRFFANAGVSVGYTKDGKSVYFPGVHVRDGSLGQAIALQIKQFAIEIESGYLVCSDCGEIFCHKRSSAKRSSKPKPNAANMFCCERCRNRYYQREHRKTDGYKLKQAQKKTGKQ